MARVCWCAGNCGANCIAIRGWGDHLIPSPIGWICPKCGAAMAPGTQMCLYCKPSNQQPTASKE